MTIIKVLFLFRVMNSQENVVFFAKKGLIFVTDKGFRNKNFAIFVGSVNNSSSRNEKC